MSTRNSVFQTWPQSSLWCVSEKSTKCCLKATLTLREWLWLLSLSDAILAARCWGDDDGYWQNTRMSAFQASWGRYLPRLFKSHPTPVLSTLFSVLNVMPRSSFQLRDPPNRNSNLVQMQHCSSSNTSLCSVWIFSISGCWTENEGSDEMTTIFRPRQCSLGKPQYNATHIVGSAKDWNP